jgi:FtsP/CotA-like multicopper oxidase with cupredoxin domain
VSVTLPATLRAVVGPGTATARQRLHLNRRGMAMPNFTTNGRAFDPSRIDLMSQVGRTDGRDIVNNTTMHQPIRIHGTQFQL